MSCVKGFYTSTGTILVLYILLVIVLGAGMMI
ncbi:MULTISPECIES: YjcZ family sporulation protein [Paenibacillus]|nr:YjcZ family sporulation protein [Paenibacillus caseinilyticus]MCZ8518453.1 YjcZ family sporulation protein [Paenibacillus caseinilyticus]